VAYLIDSDLAIDHLGDDADAVRLIGLLAPDGLAMSAVSLMEVSQGVGRGPFPQDDAAALDALLAIVRILAFDIAEARRSADLRETLRGQGRRVSSRALDLMIAATAIEHDLILVTRNVRDSRDVPGLVLYASA